MGWKIRFRGHSREKPIYRGDCLKRLGQFADLRGAWQERGGCFWEGIDMPMHTMIWDNELINKKINSYISQ